MGRIFCIMGKSSTGKDTIYKALLKDDALDLHRIIPYTTRPIRQGEQDGQEYFFVDETAVKQYQEENRIIEMRTYDTCFGPWRYFTVNDNRIDLDNQNYLVIGTPEAYFFMSLLWKRKSFTYFNRVR